MSLSPPPNPSPPSHSLGQLWERGARSLNPWHSKTRLTDPSFRLIFYLEWILLGLAVLFLIRPVRFGFDPGNRAVLVLILVIFGLMGLRLPTQRPRDKIIYTAIELGLLLLSFQLDHRTGFFPLLGLIIVIRSCLIFEQPGRQIVAVVVFITAVVMLFSGLGRPPHPPRPRLGFSSEAMASIIFNLHLNAAITFGLTLLFILLLVNALLAERQSREKLSQVNEQLRQYALRIEDQAMLQERNRIAREIHDALGHALTAQSIQLENALLFLPPGADQSKVFLQQSQQLGAQALQEVRRSVSTLRSHPLQGRSLTDALTAAIAEFQCTTGITPKHDLHLPTPLSVDISTSLYRIVQECLTNIAKHSHATQVSIQLQQHGGRVHLYISDNGDGFDPHRNTTGFGLQGMRERATALGGEFQLSSQLGQGCQIMVTVPLLPPLPPENL